MDDLLESFLDQMTAASDLEMVKTLLSAEIQSRGFEHFAYVQLRPPRGSRQRIYIGTYPASWSAYYREMDLQIHDPVYSYAADSMRPFLWSDVRQKHELPTAEKMVFAPAADIGLRAGGGIPIHGPRGASATLHVADDSANEAFAKRFYEHRLALPLIASTTHETIARLTAEGVPLDVQFTARQKEILLWAIRGKTNWEIGTILGIKEDTVRQHMMKISSILDARNRAQATALAVTHHIVNS